MTDCVTEGGKRLKREEKREERKNRGTVREKRREERRTGNNFSLEERPHIEKLLSNKSGHIREHADTQNTIP